MKKLMAAWWGLVILGSVSASTPPPWFHAAMVSFLDQPRVVSLGWSKDGKTALLSPVDGEGRGGTGVDLWVIDTVEDTVIKAVEVWSDEFDDLPDNSEALAQAITLSKKAGFFFDAVAGSGIVPVQPLPLEMLDFPLIAPQGRFTADSLTNPVGEAIEGTPGRTLDWRLVMRSDHGEKTIAKGREDDAIDVRIEGYVASPWEPRVLVVYGITHPGYEGEQPLSYSFSGCLLTKGFAAK